MEAYYLGVKAKKMKPTKKHRPAVWEMMLGTVYAMNNNGEVKYFDYNHDEAIKFAGLGDDVRTFRTDNVYRYGQGPAEYIQKGRLVLWTN